jgi:hypothetical protein
MAALPVALLCWATTVSVNWKTTPLFDGVGLYM